MEVAWGEPQRLQPSTLMVMDGFGCFVSDAPGNIVDCIVGSSVKTTLVLYCCVKSKFAGFDTMQIFNAMTSLIRVLQRQRART